MKPILLLEINEVPWRLLDRYLQLGKFPALNEFFSKADRYTTIAVDEGELSPWITWPTVHRGLPGKDHGVHHLGQDPKTYRGKPIWQEVREHGYPVGVFGSLQSWPPQDPGKSGFFVPDTFAHDERCIPSYLEPLQRFNLDQVAKNGRVVQSSSLSKYFNLSFLGALLRSGVRARTLLRIGVQLLREKWNPALRSRRPAFQSILFWDIFRRHFRALDPPAFSSFFTNHIASVMHRYWNHVFPEDFPEKERPEIRSELQTMDFAFAFLDEMLAQVLVWLRKNPELTVVFAASMGQAAIHRLDHCGYELVVTDLSKLLSALEISGFTPLLAMVPQVAAAIPDAGMRAKAKSSLEGIRTASGGRLFTADVTGESISITILAPRKENREDCVAGTARLPSGRVLPFADLGIRCYAVEAGTAYHIPEGSFAVLGRQQEKFRALQKNPGIPADKVKGLLLQIAEL